MLNLSNGISLHPKDSSPPANQNVNRPPANPAGMTAPAANQPARPAAEFVRTNPQAAPANQNTPQPQARPANPFAAQPAPANLAQVLGGNMQHIAAQVATYFSKNIRSTSTAAEDRDEHQRRLNDEASPGIMGESKVEESNGADSDGGES